MPYKIAIAVKPYFPISGGPSTLTYNLKKNFNLLGHEVTLFAPIYDKNINVIEEPFISRLFYHDSFENRISRLIIRNSFLNFYRDLIWNDFYEEISKNLILDDFDIIYTCNVWPQFFNNNRNDLVKVSMFGTMPIHDKSYIYKKIMSSFIKNINYKVANCDCLKELLYKYEGITINKIIYNGVDANMFKPNDKYKEDKMFIIGVVINYSYIEKVKGLLIVLNTFNLLCKKYSNLKLKIIGDGKFKNKIIDYVGNFHYNVKKNIFFLDQTNYNNMPSFYNSINLFVHISFRDALPHSLMESLSCCVPVLANDIGDVRKIINDEVGWIIYPNEKFIYEKISEIIDDKELLKEKGMSGRNFMCTNFSWEKTAKKYLALYNE